MLAPYTGDVKSVQFRYGIWNYCAVRCALAGIQCGERFAAHKVSSAPT